MSEEKHCQDDFIPAENSLPETEHYPLQSVVKDYGTFNAPINLPPDTDCTQSNGKHDSGVSMSTESRSLKSCSDNGSELGANATLNRNHDAVQPDLSVEAVSPQFNDEFVHESDSSHSSTVFNSIDADFNVFAEEEEDRVDVQAGSGLIKRANSLCGLQSIIAGSYTGFPLSPCDPDPLSGNFQKTFEHHIITSEQNSANDKELIKTESLSPDNNAGPLCEQLHDINSNASSSPSISPSQPSALDAYDYKYGDMFFFTVRLDPGSPELHNQNPVCPEHNDVKKDESNGQINCKDTSLSPEFNDVDEFECSSPEDTEQHNQITNDENELEVEIATHSDPLKHDEILVPDSEKVVLDIPCLTFNDSNACQSVLDSEWNDQWMANTNTVAEPVPDSSILNTESNPPNSIAQDVFCLFSNTATDPFYAHEQLSPESSSLPHKPSCSEGLAMSKLELHYFDPFSPIPAEPIEGVSDLEEINTVNLFCHEAPRLDSGYHEVGTPTPFSPEPADKTKCSIDLQGPGLEIRKQSNSEIHVPDPFSPIPAETIEGISDLEEINTVNSFCHEAPRLDSGYHKVGTPTPFSPEPADKTKCSIDLQGPGLEIRKQSNSEIQVPDPFSPIPAEPVEGVSDLEEINTVNSFCHEAPRLDSGYHEVGTPTPFSPEPADKTKCSIDLQGPGLEIRKQSNSEIHVPDPFSPIPAEPVEGVSDLEEINTVNLFCHEAPRLDSGYHEVGTPTPFSPEPADKTKCSIDLQGPGLEIRKQSNSEIHVPDPFSPIPAEPVEGVSDLEEINTVNLFCHEAPRLDSGYHEVGTPTPFSPEPAYKTKCSIDLQGPGLEIRKQSNSEIHVPDPFSPESVDTGIFDSETENCESGYMINTCQFLSPHPVYTDLNNLEEKQISCDVLSDHLSGSEHDDCYPFGFCPSNEESYAYSSEEKLIEPIREGCDASGESKPCSIMSNASDSSQVFHCGSVWGTSEMSFPNSEVLDPMKNNIFDFNTMDVGSFLSNVSQEAEEAEHGAGKVPKNTNLAEIDYFCSELSKMVSSSSSDSVQQSVAEMLFGSEPNASSFYPWDFEKPQHSC